MPTVALDHDFEATSTLTPYGIFLPAGHPLSLFFVCSKLTADWSVDLMALWWEQVKDQFSHRRTLVLNQDHGPETPSRRTQFMSRLVALAHRPHLKLP